MGYRYIGPTSFYRLTIPEIARLYRAWSDRKQHEADEAERKEQEQYQKLKRSGTDVSRPGAGQPRESDWKAMERFKREHDLN